jgi:hypothetical protein
VTCDIQALVGRGHGHNGGIDVAASGVAAGRDWARRGQATPPTYSEQAPGLATFQPFCTLKCQHMLSSTPTHSNSQTGDRVVATGKASKKYIVIFVKKNRKWCLF